MSEILVLRKVHLMATSALISLTNLRVRTPNRWTATQTRQQTPNGAAEGDLVAQHSVAELAQVSCSGPKVS